MALTLNAMKELKEFTNFTQLRFYCSKPGVRTLNLVTALNSTGEAVVQYFSGQTNVQPDACGSFIRLDDDNSKLAQSCHRWGKGNNDIFYVGKWGRGRFQTRLIDFPIFEYSALRWSLYHHSGKFDCDDKGGAAIPGSFWQVFVRWEFFCFNHIISNKICATAAKPFSVFLLQFDVGNLSSSDRVQPLGRGRSGYKGIAHHILSVILRVIFNYHF